jgi:hypothetical protein
MPIATFPIGWMGYLSTRKGAENIAILEH